jgi:predicted glycosyltransferase
VRLLIEAHHPAHIHFFKYAIQSWRQRGDAVLLVGRDRDVMRQLLRAYAWIPSKIITTAGSSNSFPLAEMLRRQYKVAREIRQFKPTIVLSLMGSYTQAARLLGIPNVIFTDSEFQHFNHKIAHPFASHIYTPECFWKSLGPKQKRYKGYHELAFLHPKRFAPRPEVLNMLGHVTPRQYVIVRTSAWNTLHDIGQCGFGNTFDQYMTETQRQCRVFVAPEGGSLPPAWQTNRLPVPADYYHDALAFARLVITEGASTASEAACLGVPAIYLSTTRRGYLDDQERRYGLVFNFTDPHQALQKTRELLRDPPAVEVYAAARERLIAEHVDVTDFLIAELDRLVAGRMADFRKCREIRG